MSDRFECELNHAQGTWKCAKKEYEAELERLREALRDACDVGTWMSGSPSFGDDGEAHEGWVNVMRPKLEVAMRVLGETVGETE